MSAGSPFPVPRRTGLASCRAQRDRDDSAIPPGTTPNRTARRRRQVRRLAVAGVSLLCAFGLLVAAPGCRGRADARPVDHRAADDDAATTAPAPGNPGPDAARAARRPARSDRADDDHPGDEPGRDRARDHAVAQRRQARARPTSSSTDTQARLDQAQAQLADTEKRLTDNTAPADASCATSSRAAPRSCTSNAAARSARC